MGPQRRKVNIVVVVGGGGMQATTVSVRNSCHVSVDNSYNLVQKVYVVVENFCNN